MIKISIVGTHGTGKTTLAYKLVTEAKQRGMNAQICNELARTSPFPLNEKANLDGCLWLISKQINEEMSAKAQGCELLVCDRSVMDMIAYVPIESAYGEIYEYLLLFCLRWFKTYDKIFWVHPTGEEIQDDGVRALDPKYQKKIHVRFQDVIGGSIGSQRLKIIKSKNIFKDNLDDVIQETFKLDIPKASL